MHGWVLQVTRIKKQELEIELNLLRTNSEMVEASLQEENNSHQDYLAKYKELQDQMERNSMCVVCSDPSDVDVDAKVKKISGDFVVNAMIVTVTAHSQQQSIFIYHVGSSVRNPITYSTLFQAFRHYMDENPEKANDGETTKSRSVYVFKTTSSFLGYLFVHYRLPLKVLHLLNVIFCQLFSQQLEELNRKYKLSALLFDLYTPYTFFKGCRQSLERFKHQRVLPLLNLLILESQF